MPLRLAFLLLALFASSASAQRVAPDKDPRIRVLLLGDSISQGYHWGVVEGLGDQYRVVRPMARNGRGFENCEGTTKGVAELERWLALEGGDWDIIHFNFGLHDLKRVHPGTMRNSNDPDHPRQAELEVYADQLARIVDRLEQEDAKLIYATTTPVPEGVRPYRENLDVVNYNFAAYELMVRREIEVNDLYTKVAGDLERYQNDRDVHFRKEGSAFLAECVSDVIRATAEEHFAGKWLHEPWRFNREVFIQKLERGLKSWIPLVFEWRREEKEIIESALDVDASYARAWLVPDLWPATGRFEQEGNGELIPLQGRAETVRTLQRDGYSIEHLLIDSRPGMRIPAHLYLPDPEKFPPPWSGVLVPCGHTYEGKSHPDYQRGGMHLARHGLAALVYDPLDQGERIQAPKDDDSRQQHWGTTSHNIVGGQARLLGWSQAGLEAWDGMRCVDYMVSREDIRADSLGVCGQSGGGTQTSQLFMIDERLKAAAPACYITSLQELARTIGPQDDEQNLFGQAAHGMDHGAYLMARAPAPFLICAAEDDFFSITGTRATFDQLRRHYRIAGYADRAQMVVAPGGHQWGEALVRATVAFLAKQLDDREIEVSWSNEVPMTLQEAQITPRGHLVWMEGERTIYDVIQGRADELRADREQKRWFPEDREVWARLQARWVANGRPVPSAFPAGDTYSELCYLAPVPAEAQERVAQLWMDEAGLLLKASVEVRKSEGGDAPMPAWLVIGAGVQSADRPAQAPGTIHFLDPVCSGELTPTDRAWYGSFGPAGMDGAYGILLGRPLLGRQVEQILAYADHHPGKETLVASGLPALAAAHAYACAPDLFTKEHAIELPFKSWEELFGYGSDRDALAFVVPGALKGYDLPDLLLRGKD